jgi:hypothetical protein
VNKCPELVKALSDAGLAALAPAVAMDYFPDSTPQELARKTDVCEGAEPFVHSHFFSESGAFGSLTEDLEQVDDGTYEILDNTSFRIGNADTGAVFRYEIDGDELSLAPVVTGEMRKEALARPLSFTPAGWSIAVVIRGTPGGESSAPDGVSTPSSRPGVTSIQPPLGLWRSRRSEARNPEPLASGPA